MTHTDQPQGDPTKRQIAAPDLTREQIAQSWVTIKRHQEADCARCGGSLLPGEICASRNGHLYCRYCSHKLFGVWPPDFTPMKHEPTPQT